MSKFKKIFMMCMAAVMLAIVGTGCASVAFTPEATGVTTGKILYVAYVRVAQDNKEIKDKVEKLWVVVNAITTEGDLKISYETLDKQFKDIINTDKLSESDKQIVVALANDILNRVKSVIDNNMTNSDGIAFLIGVRDGVNSMLIPTVTEDK